MVAATSDVERIAYAVVQQCAPEEEPFFDQAVERFRRAPDEPPRPGADRELGFGLDMAAFVAGLALWLTQEVLGSIKHAAAPGLDRASKPIRTRLRALLARLPGIGRLWRSTAQATLPAEPLDPTELARVREVCLAKATAAGVDSGGAQLIADAIIGQLALRP